MAATLLAAIAPASSYVAGDDHIEDAGRAVWWTQWRAGLVVAASSRTLRVLLLFGGVTAVGEGVMGTLFPAVRARRARQRRARLRAGDLVIFLYPLVYVALPPALVLMVVVGLLGAAVGVSFVTLLQKATRDAYPGRVFGPLLGLESGGLLLGSVLAGWLGDRLGIVPVIAWQGMGYLLLGAVVWATLGRDAVDETALVAAGGRRGRR